MSRVPSYQSSPAPLPTRPDSEGARAPFPRNPPISYPQIQDGPQTVHRPDLFFVDNLDSHTPNARQSMASQQRPNAAHASFQSHQLYPYHQQAFYHYSPPTVSPPQNVYANYPPPPPTYQYNSALDSNGQLPPTLPPKPIVYPDINPPPSLDYHPPKRPVAIPSALPPPPPEEEEFVRTPDTEDSNELAMALALSQSESIAQQKLEEQLRNQEEEDLARALAESMLSTGSAIDSTANSYFPPYGSKGASSSNSANGTPRHVASPVSVHVDLPESEHISIQPAESSTEQAFPEFGRHEKWHIPGMQDPQTGNSSRIFDDRSEKSGWNTYTESASASSHALPVPEYSPRPSSISSVSSLAYMRDPPDEQVSNHADADYPHSADMDGKGSDGDPHDSSPHMSPEIASIDSHSSELWASGRMVEVYAASEEPNVLVFDDEAYARQLAAEEEALAAQEQHYPNEKAHPMPLYNKGREQSLPLYTPSDEYSQFVTSPTSDEQAFASFATASTSVPYPAPASSFTARTYPYPTQFSDYTQPAVNRTRSRSDLSSDFRLNSSSANATLGQYFPAVTYPALNNHHEPEYDALSEVSHHSSNHSSTAPQNVQPGRQTSSLTSSQTERRPSGAAAPVATAGILNANHYIDRQLLLGVSIGFKTPAVSATLVPMEDPMPNIISLPYSRCPPLHLQAPDWRHLLRLMARLSGTRIEPTVEAMAVTKTELKLRTVVQFIRPNSSFSEWRTILWFTVDHPIPPSAPGAARYLTPNPNLLPWSYTLSPVPVQLRDAADTHISKTYTIPASESVPLPNLPITFPNLALYLQAALDESRRHINDSSTGLGKLGKVMQMCYPTVEQTYSEFDIPERTGMSNMFKRVMKRANKDRKKGKTTNNEETYQLVTPFVPDEWG